MNTVRLTSEEREEHDRIAYLISIPHHIAEFADDEKDEINWEAFEKEHPEMYKIYCELSLEEIDKCLDEARKIGGNATGYLTTIRELNLHLHKAEDELRPLFY